jgi:hypothetical protein
MISSNPTPISRLSRSSNFSLVKGSSDLFRSLRKLYLVSDDAFTANNLTVPICFRTLISCMERTPSIIIIS